MDVLVVGSGGREHALARALAASAGCGTVWVSPGNGGTDGTDRIRNLAAESDVVAQASRLGVGLVVVGPEAPLADGLADRLGQAGIPCFGPRADAARIEASKAWSKAFMDRHGIPTARWRAFRDFDEAREWVQAVDFPVVVKASGLAAGKGVLLPDTKDEAIEALSQVLRERAFGDAGTVAIVEERLTGPEASVLAFCDGARIALMPPAQDHKRALDGDRGLNTGGMGAYAPAPVVDEAQLQTIGRTALQPVVDGLGAAGTPYVGVLYAGVMLTPDGVRVLEYNCRLGDPETQVLLPLLDGDLLDVVLACVQRRLDPAVVRWKDASACTVVAASAGYPRAYPKGLPIDGVDHADAMDGVTVFHAGTRRTGDGLVTSGGRVLAVTGVAQTLGGAVDRAYAGLGHVHFEGLHHRTDIAAQALGDR